ncbi:hypothetical protein ACFL56_02300 [Candidatus Margulisiibacteriota bacterium]
MIKTIKIIKIVILILVIFYTLQNWLDIRYLIHLYNTDYGLFKAAFSSYGKELILSLIFAWGMYFILLFILNKILAKIKKTNA